MRKLILATLAVLFLGLPQAQAQSLDGMVLSITDTISDVTDEVLPGVSNVRIGLGPEIEPDFEGSDNYDVGLGALISIHYRDLIFIDNGHLRVNIVGSNSLLPSSKLKVGPSLSINRGRRESDSSELEGLGNTGRNFELGIYASYDLGPVAARLRMRKDIADGHEGTKVIGDVRFLAYKTERVAVVTSLYATWGDDNYMNSFFSITPEQSLASGLPEFDASAGLKEISLNIGTNYSFSERWDFVGSVSYSKLLNDAKDSPLVTLRGNPNLIVGAIYAVYRF